MKLEEQQQERRHEEEGEGENLPPLIISMARLSSHTHPDPSCSSLPGESCISDLPSVHTAILRQDSETLSMESAVSSPTSQTSFIETDQESSFSSARSALESCPSYLDTLQQAQDATVSVEIEPAEEFTDLTSSSENALRQTLEETRVSCCSAGSGDLSESQEARVSCRSFESDRLMQAMQSKDAMAFVKNGPTQFMESASLSEVQRCEITEEIRVSDSCLGDEFTGLPSSGHETADVHGVPCPPIEDMQRACTGVCRLDEPQVPQRSLSRASSLSAKALEYVPKTASVSNGAPAMLTDVVHDQVVLPLMMPTPLLGSLPSGVFNVQKPAPCPPTSMMLSSSSSVLGYPQSGPMVSQSLGVDVEAIQDKHEDQAQDLVPAANINPALTEELKAKIIKQVEYYFSDANLPTDHHLMKFVKKDAEGFVPISIVANFRRVKNLLKNHALVATALQSSKQLVVSEDGRKVRRLHPLPHVDLEEIQSRTVVAENLPEDHSTESMERLFGSVGNVKMVRICQPEAANGANQTFARFMKADMVVSNKLHALIEYESVEQAERAVDELTDKRNWRSGLHVRLLLRRTFQNKHGHQQPIGIKAHKLGVGGDVSDGEEDAAPLSGDDKTREESHLGIEKSDEPMGNETVHMEKDGTARHGRGRGRGRGKGRGQFHPNGIRHHPMGTPPQASNFIHSETKPPPGPRMPDGTRGFTLGRGKVTLLQ